MDVTLEEVAPCKMLIHSVVMLIQLESSFVASLSGGILLLHLVKESNLEKGVNFTFDGEGARDNRVLEVGNSFMDLVGLRKDCSKLEENLTLLVEVGGHLENRNESADSMFIRFELLVENSNTIPQLRVLDVIKGVKSMLVSIECTVTLFGKKVAMPKSSPRRSILR